MTESPDNRESAPIATSTRVPPDESTAEPHSVEEPETRSIATSTRVPKPGLQHD